MLNFKFLTVLAILAISTVIPTLAMAQPLATSAADWQYVNSNSWGWNYSPTDQFTVDNVADLEVKWIFPLQGTTFAPSAMQVLSIKQGTTTPPIVNDGTVFVVTNYLRTYAIDAATGEEMWTNDYEIDVNATRERLPILELGGGGLQGHLHGFRYWEAGNALLLSGMACDFYGVDADSGETSFWVKDLCLNVPGNAWSYRQGTVSQTNIGTWKEGRQFIFVLPGIRHSTLWEGGDFRHTTIGVDMDTHNIVWRLFSFPPHNVLTKDWALQECDIGFFRDIPCSTVAAQAPENLEWDWAQPNEPPHEHGGVTANWGEIIIDEETGYAYTNTGNQGPYTYIGSTPGPRLYGSTIMAIDMNTGQRAWWQQPMPRDPYDYDCNWGGVLADITGYGKVYMKGCKEGWLTISDAVTGQPVHMIDLVDEQVAWGQIGEIGGLEYSEGGIRYHTMDPFSHYDMREMVAPDDGVYCPDTTMGGVCNLYPTWSNGIFGTDMTYDPETETLFHYAVALQRNGLCTRRTFEESTRTSCGGRSHPNRNTTIVARDPLTGVVKWTWFYETDQQRAHMVVTNNILLSGFTDGFVRYFDKNTGELLREQNLGSRMTVGLTTGQDSAGDQKIFSVLQKAGSNISPTSPGTLIAIGLSERAAMAQTVTTTAVSTSTIVTTNTVSVTEEVEVGLSSTITYAAIAVAVIAVIAAAVLATRKT